MNETLNCSWCGGESSLVGDDDYKHWVHCYQCGCRGPAFEGRGSACRQAIAAWNILHSDSAGNQEGPLRPPDESRK